MRGRGRRGNVRGRSGEERRVGKKGARNGKEERAAAATNCRDRAHLKSKLSQEEAPGPLGLLGRGGGRAREAERRVGGKGWGRGPGASRAGAGPGQGAPRGEEGSGDARREAGPWSPQAAPAPAPAPASSGTLALAQPSQGRRRRRPPSPQRPPPVSMGGQG